MRLKYTRIQKCVANVHKDLNIQGLITHGFKSTRLKYTWIEKYEAKVHKDSEVRS